MDGPPRYHIASPNLPQYNGYKCQPWQNELQGNYRGLPFMQSRRCITPPRTHSGFARASSFCVEPPPRQAPPQIQQYLDINPNESIGNHDRTNKDNLLQSELYCHACKRWFQDNASRDAHLKSHTKCDFPNCSFIASRQTLKLHEIQYHQNGKLQIILDTPEQIAKWREERKRNYPTLSNVTKKQEEEKQRGESGQTLLNKEFRYNKRQGWKHQRGKRGKGSYARGSRNRNAMPLEILQDRVTTTKENDLGVNNDKTGPLENETKETVINSGVLGDLAAVYAASSSDEDNCDKNKEQSQTERVEKSNEESELCPVQENKKVKLTKSNADDDEELVQKKTYLNRVKKTKPNRVKKKRNQGVVQNGRRPRLLEMLLAPDIRHERNIILQCLRYIVKKDFFGIGC